MPGFDLDLESVEREIEDDAGDRVVLGVLDGDTPPTDWIEEVAAGNVLVLDVDGDLDTLAAGFAGEVSDAGGSLVHFRDFLIVTPPGITIDTDRL